MTPRPSRPGAPRPVLAAGAVLLVASCLAAAAGPDGRSAPAAETTAGGRVSGDVVLSGRVRVTEDLLIPPGATLVVSPGSVLTFDRSESSKVDPESFFAGTEIVVRGALRASGAVFRFPGRSGGIVVAGGRADFSDCDVTGAEAGLSVLDGGTVTAAGRVRVAGCRVGVALFPSRRPAWEGDGAVVVENNGIGAVRFAGASPVPASFRINGSEEADLVAWNAGGLPGRDAPERARPAPAAGARRIGDTFLERDATFSGDVIVDGVVRVAPDVTLTVAPGSRIFFSFRDTDGDGVGENGIFLQGNLAARGTADSPIAFLPLGTGGKGRWDAVNFMASDRGENVIEHVEIAGAYRGLHAHFSRLRGRDVRIRDCYRGVQFQESEVELSGLSVEDATSALRCRDSNVAIAGFRSRRTASGINVFRSTLRLDAPDIEAPGWYGLRFRESRVEVTGGQVRGGLVGAAVQDGTGRLARFRAVDSGLAGFSAQDSDVKMEEFVSEGGLLDALSATGGSLTVSGGALSGFGRFAVKLGGPSAVVLRGVALAPGAGARKDPIHDGRVAPGLGVVKVE